MSTDDAEYKMSDAELPPTVANSPATEELPQTVVRTRSSNNSPFIHPRTIFPVDTPPTLQRTVFPVDQKIQYSGETPPFVPRTDQRSQFLEEQGFSKKPEQRTSFVEDMIYMKRAEQRAQLPSPDEQNIHRKPDTNSSTPGRRNSEGEIDFTSFSKKRVAWTPEDDDTLDRVLQQVQGCAKLVSLANNSYRRINRCIKIFNAVSATVLSILTGNQLYDSANNNVTSAWVSGITTGFSLLKLLMSSLLGIFNYDEKEVKCIQLEDSCANLHESIRNVRATPSADRLSPTAVLQKIVRKYLEIRRGMIKINIIADQEDNYRSHIDAVKNRTQETKDVYLSVVDDF